MTLRTNVDGFPIVAQQPFIEKRLRKGIVTCTFVRIRGRIVWIGIGLTFDAGATLGEFVNKKLTIIRAYLAIGSRRSLADLLISCSPWLYPRSSDDKHFV
jgi:hypothetical protein